MNIKKKYYKLLISQIVIFLLIILTYIYTHSSLLNLTPYCFWREHFNILCPSCGSTRAVANLLNGNIRRCFFI